MKNELHMTEPQSLTGANITILEEKRNSKTILMSPQMMQEIKESFVIYLRSHPEFVKDILTESLKSTQGTIELKKLDKATAKKLIQEYIEKKPGCITSDIIMKLELDPMQVMGILKELKEEDLVQAKDVE